MSQKVERICNLVDDANELVDPNPDIHELFMLYDQQFFSGVLSSRACTVEWSKRMTSCAGICQMNVNQGLCSIRLSEPLLKLRKRRDLIETLLHEMIHAYLFLTGGMSFTDRDGHGPEFQNHMNRINAMAGTSITIYHSFNAEVSHYKQHWWRCTGPCKEKAPYYGWVKRANNRAPGPYDHWWNQHQMSCNGNFVKVKEPEKQSKPSKSKKSGQSTSNTSTAKSSKSDKMNKKAKKIMDPQQSKIDQYLPEKGNSLENMPSTSRHENNDKQDEISIVAEIRRPELEQINNKLFPGKGYRLDGK